MSEPLENPVDVARRQNVLDHIRELSLQDERRFEDGSAAYRSAVVLKRLATQLLREDDKHRSEGGSSLPKAEIERLMKDLQSDLADAIDGAKDYRQSKLDL
jgi:hypothetical protein